MDVSIQRGRLAAAIKPLLAFRSARAGPPPWRQAFLGATGALALGLLLCPGALAVPDTLGQWGVPAAISVEVAINRVAFDRPSHVDERVCRWLESANDPSLTFDAAWPLLAGTVNESLREDAAIGLVPLLDLPALTAGSDESHAARLAPYAHNESSITLVVELLLRLHPDLTLEQALGALHAIRLAWLWVFALALRRGGASPLLTVVGVLVALAVVAEALSAPPLAAAYASLMPALLGAIGAAALMTGARLPRRPWAGPSCCLIAGAGAVFLCNLRTSYAPIVATLVVGYLLAAALDLRRSTEPGPLRRAGLWATNALALVVGFVGLDWIAFAPARVVDTDLNAHYHVLAHPVVLSLALPANELSVSEGIEWYDYCGITLARREDPTVKFQRSGYEAALFAYYRRLWRTRTIDMLETYAIKFGTAGVSALEHWTTVYTDLTPAARLVRLGLLPLSWVQHGALFAVVTLAFAVGGWWCKRSGALPEEGCWLVMALGCTALLCYLESAVVVSTYSSAYHGMLAFFSAFAGHTLNCVALDQVRRWSQRRR